MEFAHITLPEDERVDAAIAAPTIIFVTISLHTPLSAPWHINLVSKDSIDGHVCRRRLDCDLAEAVDH